MRGTAAVRCRQSTNSRISCALLGVVLLAFLSLLLIGCSGDDDSTSASDAADSTSTAASIATATPEASQPETPETTEEGPTEGPAPDGAESVGVVRIGDESWNVVSSDGCDFESVSEAITVVSIKGHAAEDESIAITIGFDPREAGLTLTVRGATGDPNWSADNETFAVRVGGTTIGGEGTFTSADGANATGSFDVRCEASR